uniref:F-box domain-containing protein n=1 Tax=Panagrolaimus superbus TaxID=310955 RepID=A0A914Y4L3_9BILA
MFRTETKSIISVSYKPIIKLQFRDSLQPPIPVSILDYIIENTNHEVLAKLYKTCKYFFVKKLILFCHQLHVCKSSPQTFVKNSCVTPFLTLLKHPFIEKFCCQILIFHDSENRNYLSASLSKICFCSLKCLQIGGQDLTMEEFLMVIDGGKLRQVNLENVQIFKCNGNIMFVEEIVELLPTVVALALRHNFAQMFTERTAQTLASLNRSTKFESFELDQIPGDFAIFFLEKFIKNNMAPKARIKIRLNPNANLNLELRFFCNAVVYKWRPVYEAPQINFEE